MRGDPKGSRGGRDLVISRTGGKEEGSIPVDCRIPAVPICWDEGISRDVGLAAQNQGKF